MSRPVYLLVGSLLAACGDDDMMMVVEPDAPEMMMPDAFMGTPSIEGTPLETFETTSCSTASVIALSRQIAKQIDCMMPGQLVEFAEQPNLVFSGGAVLPYMSEAARTDLYAAVAAQNGARTLQVNSGFRTVAQQFLLYRWYRLGRCGIPVAAEPGRSNHESGRAIDVANWQEWVSILAEYNWDHTVPGDEVHFDHTNSPDIRGAGVLAFQQLWNVNAPNDPIDEDGDFGPATEMRMRMAPAEGFGIGATCE